MSIEITADLTPETKKTIEDWRELTKRTLPGGEFNRALQYALNHTLGTTKTKAKQVAARGYTAKSGRIAQDLHTLNASVSGSMEAKLMVRGGRLKLPEYKTKKMKDGVFAQVRKDSEGGNLKYTVMAEGEKPEGAFHKKSKGEAGGLFIRKYRGPGSAAKATAALEDTAAAGRNFHGRFPIRKIRTLAKMTGPAVVSMVGHDEQAEEILQDANERLSKRIDHEMKRMLSK